MNPVTNQATPGEVKRGEWVRKKLIPILTLILVIAITASIYLVYGHHLERLAELKDYVYWGAFLISLVGNATIILPGTVLPVLSAIGAFLYPATGPVGPIMVGLAGGTGAAIGEITGYMVGYSGQGIAEKSKMYRRVEGWMKKWGALTIFILSLIPFFFDLVGITAGVLHFPLWKFILISWLGRTILYVGIILAATLGWEAVLLYLG